MARAMHASDMPVPFKASLPDREWFWRTHDGEKLRPSEMKTSHLFYTLRMIWNHRMPEEMQVGRNVRRWILTQPREYLAEAIIRIGRELSSRNDLPSWMRRELEEMASHFQRRPLVISGVKSLEGQS